MKAPTPAPSSVSTDVYGWSSTARWTVAMDDLGDDAGVGAVTWPVASLAGWMMRLGLTETTGRRTNTMMRCLQESRGGRNVQHRLVGLLRQSVYSRLAGANGYEDTNEPWWLNGLGMARRGWARPTMRIAARPRWTARWS